MEVVFIQPQGSPAPNVVSVGALGCMNALACDKLGLYQHEASDDVIAGARVIVIPLHWYFPLAAVVGLAAHVRRVNPRARIVLGGLTAALFARQLVARNAADFVLTGDSEEPLRLLIEAIVSGAGDETLASIPNVWSALGPPRARYCLDARAFGAVDALSHDWFPSFARFNRLVHAAFAAERFAFDGFFPFVPLVRGCRHACEICFGGHQGYVYGGARLRRPALDIARDVERLCSDGFRFVNFLNGLEHARDLLDELPARVPMAASAYFCDLPSPELLDGIVARFEQCLLFFTDPDDDTPYNRAQAGRADHAASLHAALARIADRNVRVVVSKVDRGVAGKRRLARLLDERPLPFVELRDNYEYALPVPRASSSTAPSDQDFERFHRWSAELQAYFAAASLAPEHAALWSHWAPFRPWAAPPLAVGADIAPLQEALHVRFEQRFMPGLPDFGVAYRASDRERAASGLSRVPAAMRVQGEPLGRCALRLDGRRPFFELPPLAADLALSVTPDLAPLHVSATTALRVAPPASNAFQPVRLELAPNELLATAPSGAAGWTASLALGGQPDLDAVPMDAASELLALHDWLAPRLGSELALRGYDACFAPRHILVLPPGPGEAVLEIASDPAAKSFSRTAHFGISYRSGPAAGGGGAPGGAPAAIEVTTAALVRLVSAFEAERAARADP